MSNLDKRNIDLRHYKTPFILLVEDGRPVIASEHRPGASPSEVLRIFVERFNAKYSGLKLIVRDDNGKRKKRRNR